MYLTKISLFTFDSKNKINNQRNMKQVGSSQITSFTNNDIFICNNNVTFAGKEINSQTSKWQKFTDGLAIAGFVGTPFLVSLGLTCAMAKQQKPEDIFLSDGTYVGNVNDMAFQSEKFNIDGDDGIFQVKDLGINITPERFDIVDTENGIYKNFESGIDINLQENKYVDPENGIFIDPTHGISAVLNANGELQNITLPDFSFGNAMPHWAYKYAGSSSSSWSGPLKYTREQFINQYNDTPEDYLEKNPEAKIEGNAIRNSHVHVEILPDDNRDLTQKIVDFLLPVKFPKYDYTKEYDVFGRETISFYDGNILRKVPIDDKIRELVEKYDLETPEQLGDMVRLVEKLKLDNYLKQNHPTITYPTQKVTMDAFLEKIKEDAAINNNLNSNTEISNEDIISECVFGEIDKSDETDETDDTDVGDNTNVTAIDNDRQVDEFEML